MVSIQHRLAARDSCKMKWLITGAGGQLGQAFRHQSINWLDDHKAFSHSELDLLNPSNLLEVLSREKPDVILNCAAWTNVELAEENVSSAYDVNVMGTYNLAMACFETGVRLLHISTDYVFDGKQISPIMENSCKNPISAYGKSKSIAEDIVLGLLPESGLVVRTSWLYSRWGNNFAKTILNKLHSQESGSLIHVVNDQIGQPTSATELSNLLYLLGHRSDPGGVYHASNSGGVSWYEFAMKIQELSGITDKIIVGIESSDLPSKVSRPAFSELSNSKIQQLGLDCMSNWKQALEDEMPHIIDSRNREFDHGTKPV
jgi:dTDP-4-dehydrorhamnose reductase